MIPDKIYLPKYPNYDIEGEYLGDDWAYEPEFIDNVAYIRKYALLDYFSQRIEELNSPLNGVFGSTEREHCNERISELFLLIDKLNGM